MKGYVMKKMKRQRGAGLIEVLVAVLVLGVGVLGVAALQSVALKNSGSSASSTNATIQVYAMLDILRTLDRTQLCKDPGSISTASKDYVTAPGGNPAMGSRDAWLNGLRATVAPDAQGKIDCRNCPTSASGTEVPTCTVGVRWDDSRAGGKNDQDNQEVEASSQI